MKLQSREWRGMFGWFAPTCPLPTREKAWVERRMRWLVEQLGFMRMFSASIILPNEECFPDPYHADERSVRVYFERVCGYMEIDADTLKCHVLPDDEMPDAAGQYRIGRRSQILIAESQLATPLRLVATIAHELAHEILLKGELLTGEEDDHELVTDLLPVVLGLGVFMANSTVQSKAWADGNMEYFQISKQGYLSSITLGYALALFAYARGEQKPAWATYLRDDAAGPFWKGLKYLSKTQDTLFLPAVMSRKPAPMTAESRCLALADRSTTVRLNALWDVAEMENPHAIYLPRIESLFDDRDEDIRFAAIDIVGKFGHSAGKLIHRLSDFMSLGTARERAAAARAIGQIGEHRDASMHILTEALRDSDTNVKIAAACALAQFDPESEAAENTLFELLKNAAERSNTKVIETVLDGMRTFMLDLPTTIRMHFARKDPEGLRLVLSMLNERGW